MFLGGGVLMNSRSVRQIHRIYSGALFGFCNLNAKHKHINMTLADSISLQTWDARTSLSENVLDGVCTICFNSEQGRTRSNPIQSLLGQACPSRICWWCTEGRGEKNEQSIHSSN